MSPVFIYLIQVNIALTLFYLLYTTVLKKDTFLRLRRCFFLSAIVFSLLYPFFAITALSDIWVSRPSGFEEATATVMMGEPGMTMVVEGEKTFAPVAISWKKILSLFYIAVTLVLVIRFVFQLLSIYGLRAKSEKQIIAGIPVYQIKNDITPFSFFSLIFIHTGKHSETELSHILIHEQTHVRQWHSVDVMLFELLCLFSWWNPFVRLMKREMAMNLEYLADNGVLREGVDSREYQYHLLRLTYHAPAVQIVNNFNVSQLKQRIMMMNKTKSPALKLAKYLLIVPLFFLFVTTNSIYAARNQDKSVAIQFADESLQDLPQPRIEYDDLTEPPPEKTVDEVFVVVDNQPEFPGGSRAMMKFLADNVRYPVIAQENGIQGRVICDFLVMKDGSINNVNVLHGVDPSLDAEVMRLISLMPKWKPGKQRDHFVNVRVVLPVVFRLQGDDPQNDLLTSEEREHLFKSGVLDDLKKVDGMLIIDEVVVVGYAGKGPQGQEVTDQEKMEGFEKAKFPGGEKAFMKFLADNVRYPVIAQENGIQGLVSAVFNVNSKGKVTFVRFEKEVDPSLDTEVKRVIESMPDWEPAKINGEVTSMTTGSHFVFRLQGNDWKPYEGAMPEDAVVVVGYAAK